MLARAQLSCGGGCAVKELLTAWRGRRIELWLQTAGCGRVVAVAAEEGAVVYRYGTNKQIFVASRCLESSVPCQIGLGAEWVRVRYDSRAAVAAPWEWAWEELEAGAGGAGASTAVDEDQTRPRPRRRDPGDQQKR